MSTRDYRRVAEVFVKASSVTGYVVGPDDFETLAMNAANGDAEAVMMLRHVAVAVEQIEPRWGNGPATKLGVWRGRPSE